MKRRDFLQKAGVAAIGAPVFGGAASRAAGAAPPTPATVADRPTAPKTARNVLVTSAQSRLAQAVADALSPDWQVRLTAPSDVPTTHQFRREELSHNAATVELVRGMDAVVHLAEAPPGTGAAEQIDYCTRCTYHLLRAAAQEGVRRLVYLSSLAMLTAYDPDFDVTEDWRPLASGEATGLPAYLGEFTCREFARQGPLHVVVLRLGRVVGAEEVAGTPFDPLWVERRDVAEAVRLVLAVPDRDPRLGPDRWSVFHIGHDSPRARFSVAKAKRLLGYQPRHNWNP